MSTLKPKRDPSIHIRESVCKDLLQKTLAEFTPDDFGPEFIDALVIKFFKKAKNYAINNRNILEGNAKLLQKASHITLNSRDKSVLFSEVLNAVRRKNHHKGIVKIKPGDKDWDRIKVITELALGFCKDFGLSEKEGFKEYCEIILIKMRGFALNKIPSLHQSICNYFECSVLVKTDMSPDLTEKLYKHYTRLLNEKIGITPNYKNNPEIYSLFVKAKEQAIISRVSVSQYIDAQFEGLDWTGGPPEPYHLIGDKAIGRLAKYFKKNDLVVEQRKTVINWDNIKDGNSKS